MRTSTKHFSAFMNRTSEFFKYLNQERNTPNYQLHPLQPQRQRNPFSDKIHDINHRLHFTAESIEELRVLVRGDNILGQNDTKIQNLIISLNRDIGTIDQMIQQIEQMKSQPQNSASVAQNLRRNLAALTQDFKTIIQERGELIEKQMERRRTTIGATSISPISNSTNFSDLVYAGDDDEVEIPMQNQMLFEQQQERYGMVRNVEQSISEITDMLIRLSEIIASHDYEIDRIDAAANETISSLEKGQTELLKYYEKVKSNKCLMLKIFAILIVFSLIFIIIV